MIRDMRRLIPGLFLAACASRPISDYVPGGAGLPHSARRAYRRALAEERRGKIEAALRGFRALSAKYPLRLGIHLHRMSLVRQHRGAAAAAALFDPPPQGMGPERARILMRLAELDEDEVAERKAVLESALAREPGEAFWRLGLADVGISAYDITAARAARERELGKVQTSQVTLQEATRVLEEARQDAETALQHDPELKEAHVLLAYIATRYADQAADTVKRDEWRNLAQHHYQEALKLDAECLAALLNLAENQIYFDRWSEAAGLMQRAVKLAPNNALVWNNLGYTYYSTGRLASAVACYREALKIDPKLARVRAALADGLRRQGKTEEALKELERARGDTDDRWLKASIAFKRAAIFEYDGNYGAAIHEYENHIRLGGSDSAKAKSRIRKIYEGAYER